MSYVQEKKVTGEMYVYTHERERERGLVTDIRSARWVVFREEHHTSSIPLFYSFFGFSDSEVQPPNQLDSDLVPVCSRRSSRAFSRSFLYSSHESCAAVVTLPGSSAAAVESIAW